MNLRGEHRYKDLKPGHVYYVGWRTYRRHRLACIPFYSLVPVVFIVAYIDEHVIPVQGVVVTATAAVISLIFVVGILITAPLRGFAYCPRCKQRFNVDPAASYFSDVFHTIFLDRTDCGHCHLPKWAPDDPEKEEK